MPLPSNDGRSADQPRSTHPLLDPTSPLAPYLRDLSFATMLAEFRACPEAEDGNAEMFGTELTALVERPAAASQYLSFAERIDLASGLILQTCNGAPLSKMQQVYLVKVLNGLIGGVIGPAAEEMNLHPDAQAAFDDLVMAALRASAQDIEEFSERIEGVLSYLSPGVREGERFAELLAYHLMSFADWDRRDSRFEIYSVYIACCDQWPSAAGWSAIWQRALELAELTANGQEKFVKRLYSGDLSQSKVELLAIAGAAQLGQTADFCRAVGHFLAGALDNVDISEVAFGLAILPRRLEDLTSYTPEAMAVLRELRPALERNLTSLLDDKDWIEASHSHATIPLISQIAGIAALAGCPEVTSDLSFRARVRARAEEQLNEIAELRQRISELRENSWGNSGKLERVSSNLEGEFKILIELVLLLPERERTSWEELFRSYNALRLYKEHSPYSLPTVSAFSWNLARSALELRIHEAGGILDSRHERIWQGIRATAPWVWVTNNSQWQSPALMVQSFVELALTRIEFSPLEHRDQLFDELFADLIGTAPGSDPRAYPIAGCSHWVVWRAGQEPEEARESWPELFEILRESIESQGSIDSSEEDSSSIRTSYISEEAALAAIAPTATVSRPIRTFGLMSSNSRPIRTFGRISSNIVGLALNRFARHLEEMGRPADARTVRIVRRMINDIEGGLAPNEWPRLIPALTMARQPATARIFGVDHDIFELWLEPLREAVGRAIQEDGYRDEERYDDADGEF